MMYSTVSSFKGILKIKETVVDNGAFKLHYKITSLLLMLFSAIVTTHQFFGDPIDCFVAMTDNDELPDKILDNYCWVQSTFTLPEALNKKVGDEVIYPGVDKSVPGDERIYHSYYQWVWVFLFVQSVFFYMPHYIWKAFEGKTIQHLLLNLGSPYPPEEKNDENGSETDLEKLTKYLQDSRKKHNFYAFQYVLCEVLNLVNVIGQMFFTNAFLGGEFTTYGIKVVQFSLTDQSNRTDPMIEVFPRMTKCTFNKYGVAGSVQQHSALCILPINMFNEKIFIFLWFWFSVLAVISCLVIVVRLLLICFSRLRYFDTKLNCTYTGDAHLSVVINDQSYTEWFVLHLLSKNMSPLNFSQLIEDLAKLPSLETTSKLWELQALNPKQGKELD